MIGIAYASGAAPPAGPAGGLMQLAPLILIILVFYFLIIRPQQKKAKEHQAFLNNLKKGSRVVTNGGLHGRITSLTDTVVTMEIADGVKVKVNRNAIMMSATDATKQNAPVAKSG